MSFPRTAAVLAVAIIFVFIGCTTQPRTVQRISTDQAVDLSGRWNDTDSRLVAQEMIDDVLRRPWYENFRQRTNRRPVVIVGRIANRSSEHIEVLTFIKDIERELINSGQVTFVAAASEREEIRDERLDQQIEADPATIARLGRETGADFILIGVITSQTDAVEGQRVVSYKVDLELINIESNEKAWIGTKEIRKLIRQPRTRW